MASDGGMLKDARVKLFLSSRSEMQKIIEDTRQQHLALQVDPNRPFDHTNNFASDSGPSGRLLPQLSNAKQMETTGRVGNFDNSQMNHQQQFNPRSMGGSLPTHSQNINNHSSYGGPSSTQHYGGHSMSNGPMAGMGPGPMRPGPMGPGSLDQGHMGPGSMGQAPMGQGHMGQGPMGPGPMGSGPMGPGRMGAGYSGQKVGPEANMERDRREPWSSQDMERNRDSDRGAAGNRRGERDRSRDRNRRDRMPETRRSRRSRSRSSSRSRVRDSRGDRRRRSRSRSSSRERRRSSRERDRNSKNGKYGGLLPTPADQMNDSSRKPEVETCIQLRMLSGDVTYRDIRDYLSGIHFPNTCIKMINAFDGHRFGLAYIRFTLQSHKQAALARHNGSIRGYPVQLFHVDDSVYNCAIDSFSPGVTLDSKVLSHSCLALRDFPPNGSEHMVKEAFGSISLLQVLAERDNCGIPTGLCFAQLASEADARKAIQVLKDGVMIAGRPVKVAFLPLGELEICKRNWDRNRGGIPPSNNMNSNPNPNSRPIEDHPQNSQMFPGRHQNGPSRRPPFSNESSVDGNMAFDAPSAMLTGPQGPAGPPGGIERIFISGLPPNVMERDIGDFFSDVGVVPQMIELVTDDNRMPTGNAYCSFSSMQEASRALDKDGGFMGVHTISVVLVENREPLHTESEMNSFNQFPNNMNQSGPPGPRMYGPGPPNGPFMQPNRPMMNTGSQGPLPNSQMGPRFGGPGPRYPPGGGPGYMGPRHSMNMRMRMPIGPNMGPGNNMRPGNNIGNSGGPMVNGSNGPMGNGPNGPNFGAPGCVVALSNVPHKGTIADILAFFRGYQINEKCIIRRFGPNGEPTGDARVAFSTPDEAQNAVRTLQNEFMNNRRILLTIL